jgi:hypothetical protein
MSDRSSYSVGATALLLARFASARALRTAATIGIQAAQITGGNADT